MREVLEIDTRDLITTEQQSSLRVAGLRILENQTELGLNPPTPQWIRFM